MGVRLTIDGSAWRAHVTSIRDEVTALVPVVKGNGYGFGRTRLARHAIDLLGTPDLAVGTVHEAADLGRDLERDLARDLARDPGGDQHGTRRAADLTPIVLTPTLDPLPADLPQHTVLTVGAEHHVEALARQGWRGRVVVKLASSMRRYGTRDLEGLLAMCARHGLEPIAASLHLPLVMTTAGQQGDHDTRLAEIEAWIARLGALPAHATVDVSHVSRDLFRSLEERHPHIQWRLRLGTELWHGDKSFLHLGATVVDLDRVRAGDRLGYRQVPSPIDGHVALVAAGSAHGVQPLDGGLSPFHHARRRLPLVEAPHMHTSMVLVADDVPPVGPGDLLDLQRPLIHTFVDEIVWT